MHFSYYAASRRITEDSGRHITVRQLESTVRLAQGKMFSSEFQLFITSNLQHMPNSSFRKK